MPQLIIATVGTSLSVEERDKLRRSIIEQMDGCDVRVVLVPPGVCIQHLPQLPFLALAPTDAGIPTSLETQGHAGDRTVQHLDTPDEEPAGIPPHVWLYRNMLTDLQRLAPLGIDETNGQYAVAVDQLTDDQAQVPHIARQLVPAYDARLRDLEANANDSQNQSVI